VPAAVQRSARRKHRRLHEPCPRAADPFACRGGELQGDGAQPLKRFLQRQIESALSRRILKGEVTENSRVTVDYKKGELAFHSEPLEA
jgi:ATP-dependent Clp protease ATP-binding subunit ClpA